jgi:hypothetical protein
LWNLWKGSRHWNSWEDEERFLIKSQYEVQKIWTGWEQWKDEDDKIKIVKQNRTINYFKAIG